MFDPSTEGSGVFPEMLPVLAVLLARDTQKLRLKLIASALVDTVTPAKPLSAWSA
jgi:hypothetical protein